MNQDQEHLDLLGIFHYVVAALAALFSCFPLIHLVLGFSMMSGGLGEPSDSDTRLFGLFFVAFASIFILLGWTFAVCTALAGRYLRKRTHYMFCLVMAGVECIFVPFGTVLGVFTIIVLQRPSVKHLFGRAPAGEGEAVASGREG